MTDHVHYTHKTTHRPITTENILFLTFVITIFLITFLAALHTIQQQKERDEPLIIETRTPDPPKQYIELKVKQFSTLPEPAPPSTTEPLLTTEDLSPNSALDVPTEEDTVGAIEDSPSLYKSYIQGICASYPAVRPALIEAMVEAESSWDPSTVSSAGCIGLLQVNPRWHAARMEKLGVVDLSDPYGGLLVGIDLMSELLQQTEGNEGYSLMAYNGGPSYAARMDSAGKLSYYASHIIERSYEIEQGG